MHDPRDFTRSGGNNPSSQSSGLSAAKRRKLGKELGVPADLRCTDTSHLIVELAVPAIKGGVLRLPIYDPVLLVDHVLAASPALMKRYEQQLRVLASPWQIIVGFDEFAPGNKLSHDNRRKTMNVYMNFAELGIQTLSMDATWYCPLSIPTLVINRVQGGWSCVLRHFLARLSSFREAGIFVAAGHTTMNLKATLGTLLTDGEGWMKALQWNGYQSIRPCFIMANVYKKGSTMPRRSDGYVDICESDPRKLRYRTAAQVSNDVDLVLGAKRSLSANEPGWNKTRLKLVVTAAGFSPTEHGLIADATLFAEIYRRCTYDWMHCSFQDGYMSTAMWLFLDADSKANGNSFNRFLAHLDACYFPCKDRRKSDVKLLFSEKMLRVHKRKGRIVGNASQQLTLSLILRDYAQTVTPTDHTVAFRAASDIIDLLLRTKRGLLTTQELQPRLFEAIQLFFDLHKAAYGTQHIRPKFAWLWAIAQRVSLSRVLCDMFSIERQHKRVKIHAEHYKNGSCNITLLMRVLDEQIARLNEPALVLTKCVRQVAGGSIANSCCVNGVEVSVDDIVLHRVIGSAAKITGIFRTDDGQLLLNVVLLNCRRQLRENRFYSTREEVIWHATDAYLPTAWRRVDNYCILIL